MATITKGHTYADGDVVTHTNLNELVDNATITGIVNSEIATNANIAISKLAVTTGALVGGASSVGAAITPDASTIEISSSTLQVKDGGITGAKINATFDISGKTVTLPDNVVTTSKITDANVTFGKLDTDIFKDAEKVTWAHADHIVATDASATTADSTKKLLISELQAATGPMVSKNAGATAGLPVKGGLATIAHGVTVGGAAAVPTMVRVVMRCTAGDRGWGIGDEVELSAFDSNSYEPPFAVYSDNTNTYVRRNANNDLFVLGKTNGDRTSTPITDSSWQLKVYAWA